jgi:hypothetical protein
MEIHTKEGNAGWIGKMQALAVFAEVLGAPHELTHLLEDSERASWYLIPRPLETMDWRSTERGYDGGQGRVIIQRATFLSQS